MSDRRDRVGFDPDHFARRLAEGRPLSPTDAFRHAYQQNLWGGTESPSGPGSSLSQTAAVQRFLPELCRRLQVRTLLDLPCGEGHWISPVALPETEYIGADLLPEVVARATALSPGRVFRQLDLTSSPLPPADLLLCRDCLVHLSFHDIRQALENIRRGGVTWLLTTNFPTEPSNRDIVTGDWRPLNFELAPFNFPPPTESVLEGCTEADGLFADKSLALWPVADLRPAFPRDNRPL